MASQEDDMMFHPPTARGMRVLDRSVFHKTIPLAAARILDNKHIAQIRAQLRCSKDILNQDRLDSVHSDPDPVRASAGKKCILLRPALPFEQETNEELPRVRDTGHQKQPRVPPMLQMHSPVLAELARQGHISVVPYQLELDYDYWNYHEIISAILPLDAHEEIPSGFSQVGHVAHMNLREKYLPYKHLIAQIILDKNPNVRTVINKIDDVGQESEFRTFKYEVLAGPDDMNVTVSEANCVFSFDYSKVYWNPRLQTEHSRLVDSFQRGEAVCDVMAGIGPFAIPAGKNGVFVWANDLNPDSYSSLLAAIAKNKVEEYVQPFNLDGRDFIRSSAAQLLQTERAVEIKKKQSRREGKGEPAVLEKLEQPKTFQHYVLNLPASALTFLSSFIGLYPPHLKRAVPGGTKMPLVHVYCFSTKDELRPSKHVDIAAEADDGSDAKSGAIEAICAEISRQLAYAMRPGDINEDGGVQVYDVRDVAPKKRMFCASFRLPEKVAFRVES